MIGGVHGSGKSFICERLTQDLPFITCVSASRIVEHFGSSKHVADVPDNQRLLIERIKEIKDRHELTVVDGHFCVSDLNGTIQYVGEDIFKSLSPYILVLVTSPSETIRQRIHLRDHTDYPLSFIEKMKQDEAHWARYTSEALKIPLYQAIG